MPSLFDVEQVRCNRFCTDRQITISKDRVEYGLHAQQLPARAMHAALDEHLVNWCLSVLFVDKYVMARRHTCTKQVEQLTSKKVLLTFMISVPICQNRHRAIQLGALGIPAKRLHSEKAIIIRYKEPIQDQDARVPELVLAHRCGMAETANRAWCTVTTPPTPSIHRLGTARPKTRAFG